MTSKEIISLTWKQLKEFCNGLPESELEKLVIWTDEEEGGRIVSVEQLEEDYVQTDYGCEPASVQEYEEGEEEYPVCLTKGSPILYLY